MKIAYSLFLMAVGAVGQTPWHNSDPGHCEKGWHPSDAYTHSGQVAVVCEKDSPSNKKPHKKPSTKKDDPGTRGMIDFPSDPPCPKGCNCRSAGLVPDCSKPILDDVAGWAAPKQVECLGGGCDSGIDPPSQTKPSDLSALMEQISPTQPMVTHSYDGCNTTTYIEGQPTTTTLAFCPKDDSLKKLLKDWPAGAYGGAMDSNGNHYGPEIKDKQGNTTVLLLDSEYKNLQQLRSAVVEEEKRLALKYGAYIAPPYDWKIPSFSTCDRWDGCPARKSDHYEFHGQFLLIGDGK